MISSCVINVAGKLEELLVERLGEHDELIALHATAVLDALLKGDEAPRWMGTRKRWTLAQQMARLLSRGESTQLQCAVLGD